MFPAQPLPLHIFEARYRLMINTILDGDKKFGVLHFDPSNGKTAKIGCCAQITDVRRLLDGRMYIETRGIRRIRVLNYLQEKPYNIGLVEWVDDEPAEQDLSGLAEGVAQSLRDIARLLAKLQDKRVDLPKNLPEDPVNLSYWVAGNLYDLSSEQQALLEIQDTGERLKREADILLLSRNQLAARTALKEALS
jgi:ATP-dependent Lon protease